MKKIIMLLTLLLVTFTSVDASSTAPEYKGLFIYVNSSPVVTKMQVAYEKNSNVVPSEDIIKDAYIEMINRHAKEDFSEELITQLFEHGFERYTIAILALGYRESSWRYMRSPKNRNGTIDEGPLGLNSANSSSKEFMEKHAPKYTVGDINDPEYLISNQYYMAVAIQYFDYLYKDYGDDIYCVYNGGNGNYQNGTTPDASRNHQRWTVNRFKRLEKEFNEIVDRNVVVYKHEEMKKRCAESKRKYDEIRKIVIIDSIPRSITVGDNYHPTEDIFIVFKEEDEILIEEVYVYISILGKEIKVTRVCGSIKDIRKVRLLRSYSV